MDEITVEILSKTLVAANRTLLEEFLKQRLISQEQAVEVALAAAKELIAKQESAMEASREAAKIASQESNQAIKAAMIASDRAVVIALEASDRATSVATIANDMAMKKTVANFEMILVGNKKAVKISRTMFFSIIGGSFVIGGLIIFVGFKLFGH